MLGVSLVGIAVWGAVGSAIALLAGNALPQLPEPALGWRFATLGLLYFAMGYLLLGSLFLTIGGMAATVREVQTLSMPVTMAQLLVFFLAASSITRPGSPLELFAAIFPLLALRNARACRPVGRAMATRACTRVAGALRIGVRRVGHHLPPPGDEIGQGRARHQGPCRRDDPA